MTADRCPEHTTECPVSLLCTTGALVKASSGGLCGGGGGGCSFANGCEMSVPVLTTAAFCPRGVTCSHSQTVTFGGSSPQRMCTIATRSQRVRDHQRGHMSGAPQPRVSCRWCCSWRWGSILRPVLSADKNTAKIESGKMRQLVACSAFPPCWLSSAGKKKQILRLRCGEILPSVSSWTCSGKKCSKMQRNWRELQLDAGGPIPLRRIGNALHRVIFHPLGKRQSVPWDTAHRQRRFQKQRGAYWGRCASTTKMSNG